MVLSPSPNATQTLLPTKQACVSVMPKLIKYAQINIHFNIYKLLIEFESVIKKSLPIFRRITAA